jgi:hypothetical protein
MSEQPQQGHQRGRAEIWVAAAALVVGLVAVGMQVLPKGGMGKEAAGPVDDDQTTSSISIETTSTTVDDEARDAVFASELRVGDCFDDTQFESEESSVGDLALVDCDEPHDAEVFFAVEIAGDEFPGDESVEGAADDSCLDAFEPYMGIGPVESRWSWGWIIPNQAGWEEDGERLVVCFVHDEDLEPIVGSKQDAGD